MHFSNIEDKERKKLTFTFVLLLANKGLSCAARSSDLSRRKWRSNPLGETIPEPVVEVVEETSPSLPADLNSLADLLSAVAGESSEFLDSKWDSEWDNSMVAS